MSGGKTGSYKSELFGGHVPARCVEEASDVAGKSDWYTEKEK